MIFLQKRVSSCSGLVRIADLCAGREAFTAAMAFASGAGSVSGT